MRARFSERCLLTVSYSSSTSSASAAIWLQPKSLLSDAVPNTWLHEIKMINKVKGRRLENTRTY